MTNSAAHWHGLGRPRDWTPVTWRFRVRAIEGLSMRRLHKAAVLMVTAVLGGCAVFGSREAAPMRDTTAIVGEWEVLGKDAVELWRFDSVGAMSVSRIKVRNGVRSAKATQLWRGRWWTEPTGDRALREWKLCWRRGGARHYLCARYQFEELVEGGEAYQLLQLNGTAYHFQTTFRRRVHP